MVRGIGSVNCLSSFLLSSVCGNVQAGEMQGSIEFLLTRFSNAKLVIKMIKMMTVCGGGGGAQSVIHKNDNSA